MYSQSKDSCGCGDKDAATAAAEAVRKPTEAPTKQTVASRRKDILKWRL